jgi:hypothetical protein
VWTEVEIRREATRARERHEALMEAARNGADNTFQCALADDRARALEMVLE